MDADASRLASGNSELANKRLQRWKRHVETIAKQLDQIRQRIGRGQLHGKDKIGVRVGKVLNKYKVGKHFTLDIRDNSFSFEIDDTKVTAEVFRFSWKMTVLKIRYTHEKRSCHEQTTPSSHRRAESRAVTPARCGEKASLGGMQRGSNPAEPVLHVAKGAIGWSPYGVFDPSRAERENELEAKISRLEARVARKDQIIAEVTEEYVTLQKKLGEA